MTDTHALPAVTCHMASWLEATLDPAVRADTYFAAPSPKS
jgi:hypothetical protein